MENSTKPLTNIRGFSLVEVMVSVVLLMVIGLGTAGIIARVKQAQRDNAAQALAITATRSLMSSASSANCKGAPASITLGSNAPSIKVTCTMTSSNFTVTDAAGVLPAINVSITRPEVETSKTDAGTLEIIKESIKVAP